MKLKAFLAALGSAVLAASAALAQPAPAERVVINYVPPADPAHRPIYDLVKENRGLERVREILLPIRWPRTLRLEIKGCDGEANAWYEEATITVCYEFLEELWKKANDRRRPATVAREDAFAGPFADVFLHEASHALFDQLKIPLLGREEDAADQVAAYHVLQFPKEHRRRLVAGSAYAYGRELRVRNASDLFRPRLKFTNYETYADEHGTQAQRLYNLFCLAYGSDKELFADIVEKEFLPDDRAERCEDEYRQVEFAYRTLIGPHRDSGP
jgi:Putative metallopeptidase